MKRPVIVLAAVGLVAGGAFGGAVAVAGSTGTGDRYGTAALVGRAVLPAQTYRPGSAPSGAFFGTGDQVHMPEETP